ncbi:hypothetical protein HanPI659440_Chr00c05g0715841 [Helianthus annuus]|nr:hypothetical protein HanPI659440_Chr00c05g0715841 [Helianthus annuus]
MPLAIFSLKKCKSNSKCLVLSWNTGFCEIEIADLLSQNKVTGNEQLICNSESTFLIHITSQVAEHIALYSASAVDLETNPCFLLFQETSELPRKMP